MKMDTGHQEDEKMMRVLYEASYEGCVSILNTLIQQDPLILYKVNSTTIFTETPLHISALLGHLEFTVVLLTHKPKLSLEFDSFRSTPLHLASAEGHFYIVKELLLACDHACLIPDQHGRIPLHYAVIRGRTSIVLELIRAKPESFWILDNGKTVFHLCVTHSHLEILEVLMELDIVEACMLLSLKDLDGNTILDLATMFKQVDITRFLLSIPAIREAADHMGFTDHKKVFKNHHIQLTLMNSSLKNIQHNKMETPDTRPPSSTTATHKGRWRKILRVIERNLRHNGNWLEEMRGNLSLVATVISTITFQALNNPPGGFVQQGVNGKESDDPFGCFRYENDIEICPGDALSAIRYPHYFHPYMKYNSIAFISSLAVVLVLVSGVPLKHKGVMWMLGIAMCITLTFLTLTYINGLYLVTPDGELFQSAWKMVKASRWIWIGFLGVAALLITWRFIIWLAKKTLKKFKHQIHPIISNENI